MTVLFGLFFDRRQRGLCDPQNRPVLGRENCRR